METVLQAIDIDATGLAICAVAVLVGAYIKGYSGFGASMLWVTSLSLVLPPLQVVPMILMFEVISSIHLLPGIWREIDWRSLWPLLLGTWLATPIGIYVLSTIPADPVRIVLSVVVFVAAVLIWRGFALKRVPGLPATIVIGGMAGLLNGSMGFVGPPVILFYFSSPIGVSIGRASIIAYFLGTDSVGTAMFAAQGLVDAAILWRTALFLPILFLGVWLGNRRFIDTEPESFRKFALCLLMALSVGLIARALWL